MKKTLHLTFPTLHRFIIIVFMFSLFESCKKADSKDVNQDKIYAEYELFYDKNAGKTYASAIFKFDNALGTQLALTAPSEIKFNGDLIPYDPVFAYYRKEYSGQVNSGTFYFKDTNGKLFSNTVTLAKQLTNPVADTIKRTSAYSYAWIGDSLAANELIGLTLINHVNPANFQPFFQYTVGSKDLVLSLKQLNQLPIGMCDSQLDRQIETAAPSATSAGAKIRGKYRALNTSVYIK